MIILLGMTQTLTVWHKEKERVNGKDVWTRTVVPGCAWDSDIVRTVNGNTASLASAYVCLLPSMAGRVSVGDWVAKGAWNVEITGTAPNTEPLVRNSLLPDVFTVKAVTDCTAEYKKAPHVEVQGV